jgi:hypothetical protein
VEQGSSRIPARDQGRIVLQRVHDEADQKGAMGLEHARKQSGKYGWPGGEARSEGHGFVVASSRDGGDGLVEDTLRVPTGREFLVVGLVDFVAQEISGTAFEELAERDADGFIEIGGVEGSRHMLQPGTSLGGANAEAGVGFAQAEMPAMLGLCFVAIEKLNEERGELINGTAQTLPGEQRAQDRLVGDARVECCGKASTSGFSA